MKGIKLHATRNHPSASASKRKAPKSRPSVVKKTKRDSLDQTEDSFVSSTSDFELDYGRQEYEYVVLLWKTNQLKLSPDFYSNMLSSELETMLLRNEAMAEKARNASSIIPSLS